MKHNGKWSITKEYEGIMKEMSSEYEGNTKGTWRKHEGNTKEI